MGKYRNNLPQLGHKPFITDAGLETILVFEKGIDLPEFASFTVLELNEGRDMLKKYYLPFIEMAKKNRFGFILESFTWRASRAWGKKLGYDSEALRKFNHQSIELMVELRREYESRNTPMVISGCIGPYGDGYHIDEKLSSEKARIYHSEQIKTLSLTEADLISAYTINYAEEAIGMTLAAQNWNIPIVISFTLETDGRLPSGQPLEAAIHQVDEETDSGPAYYMINCAHPTHFNHIFSSDAPWGTRIRAIRANASCKSHTELDQSSSLDSGNPNTLGKEYAELINLLPDLTIFGGCCGTDHHHIEAICKNISNHFTNKTKTHQTYRSHYGKKKLQRRHRHAALNAVQ